MVQEAVRLCAENTPDLILMDLIMPDGRRLAHLLQSTRV